MLPPAVLLVARFAPEEEGFHMVRSTARTTKLRIRAVRLL